MTRKDHRMSLDRRTFLTITGAVASVAAATRDASAARPRVALAAHDVRATHVARGDRTFAEGAAGRCASRRASDWHGGYTLADFLP
jgi:hypothetical protein